MADVWEREAGWRAEIEASMVERFRSALMEVHAADWTMEVCAEAARVCAKAWCDNFFGVEP